MVEPQKFRHRVDEIEAVQITLENIEELAVWCNGEVNTSGKASDPTDVYTALVVRTMRGEVELTPGYWLIKNSAGRFEGMTDGNFKDKYAAFGPTERIIPEARQIELEEFSDEMRQASESRDARRRLFGRPDRLH